MEPRVILRPPLLEFAKFTDTSLLTYTIGETITLPDYVTRNEARNEDLTRNEARRVPRNGTLVMDLVTR